MNDSSPYSFVVGSRVAWVVLANRLTSLISKSSPYDEGMKVLHMVS